jgi:AmmeMemoRadiSam system protein A
MSSSELTPSQRTQLLDVARAAIGAGLDGRKSVVRPADYAQALREPGASFVTLEIDGQLRGCMGMLEATESLISGVAHNAYAAAFEDPRFAPLTRAEYPGIEIHLSLLSVPQPMTFSSQADLLAQLHPHEDGLVIEEGGQRGTFLPAVWEQLPDPRDFLAALKRKAGLPTDHWSRTLVVRRYRVESIRS